jgi:AbrB family looped-hinge helix DNA binding protein
MTIKVSIKGHIVLPGPLRRKLGICAGDALIAKNENGRIVLIPQRKKTYKAKIVRDPITGLPVLNAGNHAPVLSSKEVREILRGTVAAEEPRIK